MILTPTTQFIVTEISSGRKYYPKGVYWTGKDRKVLVIVGDRADDHTIRKSVQAKDYDVEVIG